MNRSRRTNRSRLGAGIRKLFGGGRSASALAEAAGAAPAFEGIEALEERQLLFTLTITPDLIDPTTNVGTIRATFGYAIPFFVPTQMPQPGMPMDLLEDFNMNLPTNPAQPPPANVPASLEWTQSKLWVGHNLTSLQLLGTMMMNNLQATMQAGQHVEFSFLNGVLGAGVTDPDTVGRLGVQTMTMEIGGNLDAADTTAQLFYQGVLVAQYTGNQLLALGTPLGGGVSRYTFTVPGNGFFDTVRFQANNGSPSHIFTVDNVATSITPSDFIPEEVARVDVGGATLAFSGPVGATVQFLDTYNRDMRLTTAVGVPPMGIVPLIDLNGDAVPDFNDGIGKIIFTNSNDRTALTMFGGKIMMGSVFQLQTNLVGQYDDYEGAGFGYFATVMGQQVTVTGLPPGPGAVIVGSPYVRDNTTAGTYNPGLQAPFTGFSNPDQGVFVQGGNAIGSVYIDGMLFGTSQISGSIDRFVIGTMFGSASIAGDLGSMVVAGDAGLLSNDPAAPSNSATSTLSQITVGRTAGSIDVGGRSLMNVTVVGDLGVPASRPPGDIYRYFEKEYAQAAFNPPEQPPATIGRVLANNDGLAFDKAFGPLSTIFGRGDQSLIFGNGYYRNDTILSAEWLNTAATAVEIHGELGQGDGVNTAEDPSDVYGIAVDGTQDLLFDFGAGNAFAAIAGDVRLVDSHGRTVAAPELGKGLQRSIQFRYHPDSPGVYYLVLHADGIFGAPNTLAFTPYVVTVSGMASTSLGSFRSAASTGGSNNPPSITVLSGSVGSIRVGTGFVNGMGMEADPSVIFNPLAGADEDASLGWYGSSITVPGNLYNITAGADIGRSATGPSVLVTVGGNFGTLYTGLNMTVMTTGVAQGDLRSFGLTVGGSIAGFDVRGGLGADEDAPMDLGTFAPDLQDSIQVRTGRNPLMRGDVGVIRVGSRVGASTFMLQTSNGSVVTGIFVDQDNPDEGTFAGTIRGIALGRGTIGAANGLDLRLGFNSDLRFFDTTRIDVQNVADQGFPLVPGAAPVLFADDSGAQFSVRIVGGDVTMGAGGFVRVVPISGSLGVAVGRIDANLIGGGQLQITSLTNNPTQVVSIGNIVVRDGDAGSSIVLSGPGQIDVWKIEQLGGTAFGTIVNGTPNGDIVAIDMVQVIQVMTGGNGDIGRTQLPAWGPQHIGPYLGITSMMGGAVRGPIFLPPASMNVWNGNAFRPITNADARTGFLDDIGSPIDPYLNGIIARGGDIFQVTAGGAIGDVMTDAATGNIGMVVANNDHTAPAGKFDGIIGNIYGNRIGSVDVGAGLMDNDHGPMATTGIVARDDIGTVIASQADSFISSNILSANLTAGNAGMTTLIGTTNFQFPVDGIGSIQMRGSGGFVDAFIGAMTLDDFWTSFFTGDGAVYLGDIGTVTGTPSGGATSGPNFFRSQMWAREIGTVTLTGGFYDASILSASNNVQRLEAAGYRNSTLGGGDLEFHENRVFVGRDLVLMTTTGMTGDINDIGVDVLGHLRTVSARNISRSTIDADISLDNLRTTNSIRGSTITAGALMSATIGNAVATSDFEISGPLAMLTVTHSMTDSIINVTGPDGRIDHVTIGDNFSGELSSAGPIDMFETTNGDISASIHTVTNQHGLVGNINTIRAGRDLDLRGDVGGTIANLVAGRHIGNQFARTLLVVHGDVMRIDVSNGQLYADLRVAGQVMNTTIGAAFNTISGSNLGLGSIVAAGHIEMVTINGDFGGQIISNSGGINVITINNGSLVPGGVLAAYAGDFNNLVINNGDLFGTVHADRNLLSIRLNGSGDGVFGHLGVNPNLSSGAAYDDHRNQLPPNVAATSGINGPIITAGLNIGRIILTSGSIFEAFIYAGRAIGTIDATGDIRSDPLTTGIGTVIAAGSTINVIHATGVITNTAVLAGIVSFGNDNFPGGTGANADVVRSGRITAIMGDGGGANDVIAAGVTAGADGVYNTGDELLAPGISYARTVNFGGTASNVSVYSDGPTTSVTPGVSVHTGVLANNDPDINDGAAVGTAIPAGATAFAFTWNGVSGTIAFSGPGKAYWDSSTGQVRLVNTSLSTTLTVNANGTLTNFKITTNNNASMGTITVNAPLAGASVIDVDAYCLAISVQSMADTTTIKAGANLRALNIGAFTGGSVVSSYWLRDLTITGNFGTVDDSGEATINMLSGSTVTVGGQDAGLINVDRDLSALSVGGSMTLAQFRVGSTVGAINAGALDRTRIAAGFSIGPVAVGGNVNETTIQAGGDLGADAAPGGTGFNADTVGAGTIGNVMIGGSFVRSNIIAGLLRGPDAYFGTSDDTVAPGISSVGNVTVAGAGVGSNVNTEQFRIEAPGSLGTVTFQGQAPSNTGNFLVKPLGLEVAPIQIVDLRPDVDSNTWVVNIQFNQTINVSTVGPALTVSEVRNGGQTLLPLTQGVDYTFGEYDAVHNILPVIFSRTITDRPLVPQGTQPDPGSATNGDPDPALPGPGVYRFVLSADALRAAVADARLDGDGNGVVAAGEDYSQDTFVGDAGDKLTGEIVNLGPPFQGAPDELINFYAPDDLDLVLDNNRSPDGLPDINKVFNLRGFIGDHPNNDTATFQAGGDTDIYKITLQAGQILRLGAMSGEAQFAGRFLMNAAGQVQRNTTTDSVQLPVNPVDLTLIQGAGAFPPSEDAYLIKTTGVYYIVVTNDNVGNILDPTVVSNIAPAGGFVGHYNFSVEVFDDGNSGFAGPTNAGNGDNVVNAPDPIVFAGNDGVFGTSDDRSVVTIGAFKFFLDVGADGVRGTADDIVSGNNDAGITSTRQNGVLTTTINSAIGPDGHAGAPGLVAADTDVYNLNNGQTIAPGTKITVRIKLADLGADLGSFNQDAFTNFAGDVQFGIFDVTDATGVNDGLLYLSPSDFKPLPGQPNKQIASRGDSSYGFDANGDFYLTFVVPSHIGGAAGQAPKMSVYLQGVYNTDYTIEVSQLAATGQGFTVPQTSQNIFIETRGGTLDWLQAGGLITKLDPFTTSVLGFTGTVGGMSVDQYVLTHLVSDLQSIFASNGLNVVFSTTPAAFEFQPYSTVFLTKSPDPISAFNADNFGYAQHVDPNNLDKNDEAVVFMPSFAQLAFTPSQTDVDSFVLSLTAAVGRHIGELMGLRVTAPVAGTPIDIMSSTSPFFVPGSISDFQYPDVANQLSTPTDNIPQTNFFLGQQNAFALLDKFLTP